jgi:hypothetical protein
MFQISSVSGEAYFKAANPVTAINGIVPFHRNIFSDADCLTAEVTDQ